MRLLFAFFLGIALSVQATDFPLRKAEEVRIATQVRVSGSTLRITLPLLDRNGNVLSTTEVVLDLNDPNMSQETKDALNDLLSQILVLAGKI